MSSDFATSIPERVARLREPATRRQLRVLGVQSLGPVTMLAGFVWAVAQPYRIAFLDPSATENCLIELAELPAVITEVEGSAIKLSSYEVAARLSFLLWGSVPDDTLNAAADAGQLTTKEQILDRIEGEQIRFINLQFSDVMGIVKSVTIPASIFEKIIEGGQTMNPSTAELLDTVEHVNEPGIAPAGMGRKVCGHAEEMSASIRTRGAKVESEAAAG